MLRLIVKVISFFFSLITYARIWHKLRLGKNELAIICPYGIGDTYFICILSKMLVDKYGRSIVLVVKLQHLAITNMFSDSISRVIAYDLTETELRRIGDATNILNGNVLIGHPSNIKKQLLFEMVGIECLNLLDCYKVYFGLPLTCELTGPQPAALAAMKAKNFMKSLNLPEGKTVLLCPACYSTEKIPADFWTDLADACKKHGLTVCTNVTGAESGIKGTMPVTVELDLIISFVEHAGHVVSARSGLCDLISSARCNKVVIYPDQKWANGTIFSGTSILKMGLTTNVKEYLYDPIEQEVVIAEIIQDLDQNGSFRTLTNR